MVFETFPLVFFFTSAIFRAAHASKNLLYLHMVDIRECHDDSKSVNSDNDKKCGEDTLAVVVTDCLVPVQGNPSQRQPRHKDRHHLQHQNILNIIYIILQDTNYRIIEIIDLISKSFKLSAIIITNKTQKELW